MDWETKFVAAVIIVVVGVIGVSVYAYSNEFNIEDPFSAPNDTSIQDQSDFYLPTISGENISAYKASCTEMSMNKPSGDLEKLQGQKIKIKGQLYGIMQNMDNGTNIQIKTSDLSLYPYIAVSYSSKIPYGLGDNLEIYGELLGMVHIDNDEVPLIKAAYIEKI